MPPRSGAKEVELKVRLPGDLMVRVNEYRHAKQHETKKDAVVELLRAALDMQPADKGDPEVNR